MLARLERRPESGGRHSRRWGRTSVNHQSLSAFIWSVADLLRGDYKQADYGKVILPFTVLRKIG
jgi:hypothetical protein